MSQSLVYINGSRKETLQGQGYIQKTYYELLLEKLAFQTLNMPLSK